MFLGGGPVAQEARKREIGASEDLPLPLTYMNLNDNKELCKTQAGGKVIRAIERERERERDRDKNSKPPNPCPSSPGP